MLRTGGTTSDFTPRLSFRITIPRHSLAGSPVSGGKHLILSPTFHHMRLLFITLLAVLGTAACSTPHTRSYRVRVSSYLNGDHIEVVNDKPAGYHIGDTVNWGIRGYSVVILDTLPQ